MSHSVRHQKIHTNSNIRTLPRLDMSPKIWFSESLSATDLPEHVLTSSTVTGASTGFGRVLTEIVLEKGDSVVATARRPAVLDDLVSKHPSDRLLTLKLDVSQPPNVIAAFAAVKDKFGRIDIVVNNAGYGTLGEVEAFGDADARAIFETNFWGTANVTKEAVKFLREVNPPGTGGKIFQVSSVAGVLGYAGMAHYSASKFGMSVVDYLCDVRRRLREETESSRRLQRGSRGRARPCVEHQSKSIAELPPLGYSLTVVLQISIVEPGGFDTAALSKTWWAPAHPAYSNPALPTAIMRGKWDSSKFGVQGDARKAMEVLYKLAALEDPPLHFPLGKDAVEVVRKATTARVADAEKYASWSDNLEKSD